MTFMLGSVSSTFTIFFVFLARLT